MVTLFGFLLFWLGVVIVYIGTIAASLLASTRIKATFLAFGCFFVGGAVCMGSAVERLSYGPYFVTSWMGTIVIYLVIVATVAIIALKPIEKREDT